MKLLKLLIAFLAYACLQPVITLGFGAYGLAERVSVWAGLPKDALHGLSREEVGRLLAPNEGKERI